MKAFFIKWIKWEYWPFWFFYIPVYFYWLYLSAKAKSLCFFSAANPAMRMGGMVAYSKSGILDRVPGSHKPLGVLLQSELDADKAMAAVSAAGIGFPCILKPDMGERGKNVALIPNEKSFQDYWNAAGRDSVIAQEFLDWPYELGVMYHRRNGASKGRISSIVRKGFLEVVGNGSNSVERLIAEHPRAFLYMEGLKQRLPSEKFSQIPANGERVLLEPIGNHCRGTTFYDANYLISKDLEAIFDRLALQIEGYYFGRFDLKATDEAAFLRGEFKVVELNGANSEPAHIYDPEMKLWKAYRDLFAHWKNLFEVSMSNRKKGVAFLDEQIGLINCAKLFMDR